MAFSLLIALLVFGGCTSDSVPRDPALPTTISDEARASLRAKRPLSPLQPDSLGEWEAVAKRMARTRDDHADLIERYAAVVTNLGIDGVDHVLITPKSLEPGNDRLLVLYVHGGGFVFGSPDGALSKSLRAAHFTRARVLSVRYPLAWQAAYPAARDRVVAVYRRVLQDRPSSRIAMIGSSAGGGLVASAVLKLRDDGVPLPAVVGLISPWLDLTRTGDTYETLAGIDPVIEYQTNLEHAARIYAAGRNLDDPGVSPIYADYSKGFPPVYVSTGTRDLFLSTTARLQRKLLDAGVDHQLVVYEGMWHAFQHIDMPETEAAWRDLARFFEKHLSR